MVSVNIWFEEKLQPQGYLIFRGDLQSYSTNNINRLAVVFMSPFQIDWRTTVKVCCLDATHCITSISDEILYIILIRDDRLGCGFPCGYMVTNKNSLGPIVQWLKSLKNQDIIVDPMQFTIDCSDSETSTISNIFPVCPIQYCLFHVSQAWNRQLSLQAKSGGRPADNRLLSEIMTHMKMILYEDNLELFNSRIGEFVAKYEGGHSEFINYFRPNWCTEAKCNLWSRAYHPLEFSHLLILMIFGIRHCF